MEEGDAGAVYGVIPAASDRAHYSAQQLPPLQCQPGDGPPDDECEPEGLGPALRARLEDAALASTF